MFIQDLKQSRNRKSSEFQELKRSLKLKNVLQLLRIYSQGKRSGGFEQERPMFLVFL